MAKKPLSIYVHYPFCKSKCPYCDFNSHVSQNVDFKKFAKAYNNEISFFAKKLPNREIKTIFFGGGTPSLMPISLVESILDSVARNFSITKNCEITLEANPTSYESEKFIDLRKTGINRLSLGIQALNDADLKFLGRQHSAFDAMKTIENARNIFDNFSFDLIYARPEQNLDDWVKELEIALKFNTKHLSLYQLTIEKGTPFFSDFAKNKFKMPSENLSAEFFNKTNEILAQNNFINYEISNYALKNYECKHNLTYWQGADYIGVGAGAHSRTYLENDKNRSAIMMTHSPQKWLDQALKNGNAIQKIDQISQSELAQELILMGLRLENGISDELFLRHFNKTLWQIIKRGEIANLEENGLIFTDEKSLKITKKGRILTNSIIEKIIDRT